MKRNPISTHYISLSMLHIKDILKMILYQKISSISGSSELRMSYHNSYSAIQLKNITRDRYINQVIPLVITKGTLVYWNYMPVESGSM